MKKVRTKRLTFDIRITFIDLVDQLLTRCSTQEDIDFYFGKAWIKIQNKFLELDKKVKKKP